MQSAHSSSSWWHVIWTTFLARSPADVRGDWRDLALTYHELITCYGPIEMSASLPTVWQAKPNDRNSVCLSDAARSIVKNGIADLAMSDRVAGDTPIRALAVDSQAVQIVLGCPGELLSQRVGRLKSRTATILSFDPASGVGGKGTWSHGFWWARLTGEIVVDCVEAHVKGLPWSCSPDRGALP
jgi:hypothetical protein